MGLAHTNPGIQEKRVIGSSRMFSNSHASSVRQTVVGSDHKVIEAVTWVEICFDGILVHYNRWSGDCNALDRLFSYGRRPDPKGHIDRASQHAAQFVEHSGLEATLEPVTSVSIVGAYME